MKILIVDDNKSERTLLDVILKDGGYDVVSAVDGAEALEVLSRERVDGIISDILMPVMDGFEFCRRVKGDPKLGALPFIFYSGTYTDEQDGEFARGLGADKLVLKPTEPSALIEIVREVFGRRRIAPSGPPPLRDDETAYFKLYNQRLIHRLEEKTAHLEEANFKLMASETRLTATLDELRKNSEQLRALSAHLQEVREAERTHIAREIHDQLGQALTALKMDVVSLADAGGEKALKSKIKSMSKLIDETVQTVRRLAGELRPGILDDLGLVAALQWQAQEFRKRSGIRCSVACRSETLPLDRQRSTALFRICQEALTNVARHAKAREIKIRLERNADAIVLEVRDDGKGITASDTASPKSLGLMGMRERALLFGGTFDIAGAPKKGTTVTVTIPLEAERYAL